MDALQAGFRHCEPAWNPARGDNDARRLVLKSGNVRSDEPAVNPGEFLQPDQGEKSSLPLGLLQGEDPELTTCNAFGESRIVIDFFDHLGAAARNIAENYGPQTEAGAKECGAQAGRSGADYHYVVFATGHVD